MRLIRKIPGVHGFPKRIEANPDKIKAVLEMTPPKMIKEVQSLTGRVAALNRFVSRATDKCLPFFKTLGKAFIWTDECQKSFKELKTYLTSPPLLNPSQHGETLFLYLAISPTAVSSALLGRKGVHNYQYTTLVRPSKEQKKDIQQWRSWHWLSSFLPGNSDLTSNHTRSSSLQTTFSVKP